MSRKKLINLGFGDERRDINVSYYYYNFSLTFTLLIQSLIWSFSYSQELAALLKCQRQAGSLVVHWGPRRPCQVGLVLSTHPSQILQDLGRERVSESII